jgi:hypothetical protein
LGVFDKPLFLISGKQNMKSMLPPKDATAHKHGNMSLPRCERRRLGLEEEDWNLQVGEKTKSRTRGGGIRPVVVDLIAASATEAPVALESDISEEASLDDEDGSAAETSSTVQYTAHSHSRLRVPDGTEP